MSTRDQDQKRYGRGIASILRALEDGTTTAADAHRLRAEIEVYRNLLNAHEADAQRRRREQLRETRTGLAQLMEQGARPVRSGVFCIIDGGREQ